jgi:hypothetical protein
MRVFPIPHDQCRGYARTVVAMFALLALGSGAATAQRVVFDRPIQVDGVPVAIVGDGDTLRSRRAAALDQGRTWLVGTRESERESDLFLMRLSSTGAIELQRTFDLGGDDRGIALLPTGSGEAWIAATTRSPQRTRALLLRVAGDGRVVWRFELPSGGQWESVEQDLQLFRLPGGELILGGTAFTGSSGTQIVHLQRLRDLGDRAELVWQSTVSVGTTPHDQLGLDISPDGLRIAIAARLGLVSQIYIGLASTSNGAVVAAQTVGDQEFIVLPPMFAPDGSLRVVGESRSAKTGRVVRVGANGAILGVTNASCTATRCRPTAATVTSDGATVVGGQDFDTSAALLQRFDAGGAPTWTRSYTVGGFNTIGSMVADGTGVVFGLDTRTIVEDPASTVWAVGRIDASGLPGDAGGLDRAQSGGADLVVLLRDADGSVRIAGNPTNTPRRLRVARHTAGDTFDFLVGPATQPVSVDPFEIGRHLHLDAQGRPTVVFGREREDAGIGALGFDTAGATRWSYLSDAQAGERWHASAMDADGRLTLAAIAGPFASAQLAVRRLTSAGTPDGPIALYGESGAFQSVATASADGSRTVALGLVDDRIVVRRIAADGQLAWRSVFAPGGTFLRLEALATLANGDLGLVYAIGFDDDARLVGLRFARDTGTVGTPIVYDVRPGGFVPGPAIVDGQRMIVALQANQPRIMCFDFGTGSCWTLTYVAGEAVAAIALDAASNTLYVAGTTSGGRARLTALDRNTGVPRFDRALVDAPPGQGHSVFVREGQPVLMATRSAPDGSIEGLEFHRITAQGDVVDRGSLNFGPRIIPLDTAWSADVGRLYLTSNRVLPDGSFGTHLASVAIDEPGRIFADSFD